MDISAFRMLTEITAILAILIEGQQGLSPETRADLNGRFDILRRLLTTAPLD